MPGHFLDNSLETWLAALATAIGGSVALRIVHRLLLNQLTRLSTRTTTRIDDFLVAVLGVTGRLFIVGLPLLLALSLLTLPPIVARVVSIALTILVWLQAAVWLTAGAREWVAEVVRRRADDVASTTTLAVLRVGVLVIVWSIVFEVVYHVRDADSAVFVDVQHELNLSLVSLLDQLGLAFAFPTRTIHVVQDAPPAPSGAIEGGP